MRGLKTQESKKFNRFWDMIQEEAQKKDCIFFGFAGEGNDIVTEDIEGEDFAGWLIPENKADAFEKEWDVDNSMEHLEKWDDFFVWAEWEMIDGHVSIKFVKYE